MDEEYFNVPLNPLRAFAIASRHKTFTAAAEYMGISQVAISRQIGILEGYLGIQLFERGARSVKLTEEGRQFGLEIAPLFDQLEDATRKLLSHERQSAVDLRIYPTLAHFWLMPMLPSLMSDYPDYTIRLDTKVEPLDFRGTQLDVAVQLGDGNWKDAKSRLLFPERIGVVSNPDYAEKMGGLSDPNSLAHATILHSKYRRRAWSDWKKSMGVTVDPRKSLEYETSLLTYGAAINGMGVAVGQVDILQDRISKGQLTLLFDGSYETGASFYVAWPTTKSVSTQTRRFIDWLLVCCGQEPEFFKKSGCQDHI